MTTEHYEYFKYPDNEDVFIFFSFGTQGLIQKAVIFTLEKDGFWNLGFGDVINNKVVDSVVSNNNDLIQVIATVTNVALDYSAKYPEKQLRIKPVDKKRQNLYNHVFRRHHTFISTIFEIYGFNQTEKEIYSPLKAYDYFELKRR
jgi:hypothetical protein